MRLFIAFRVPSEPLLSLQQKLPQEGLKFVHDFHCTLKFLGEIASENVQEVIDRLRTITFSPFTLHFDQVGCFPTLRSPRVIWVGLSPAHPVVELQHQIEDALESMFTREERFAPHVTLGRVKSVKVKKQVQHALQHMQTPSAGFVLKEFLLMKSALKRSGPVYTLVEQFGCGSAE